MKTKLFVLLFLSVLMFGCSTKGESVQHLNGSETNLPEELKGLKVYSVAIDDDGTYVKVAVLNGHVNSTTYQVGKVQETTIQVEANPETIPNPEVIASDTDKDRRLLELERQLLSIEREIQEIKQNR